MGWLNTKIHANTPIKTSKALRLRVSAVQIRNELIPILQRPFDLHRRTFAFVAMLFTQLDRQRFQQAKSDIHRLKILRLDVGDIPA